ncbi:hypothetical protein BKA00_003798 [Actinomadura coerulea]|uniref:Ricin B lectin domain-containing protein n=1 Tax=Actinomadura coerulea TaxID=46159 RepID=A0A7X0G0D9_9ACTN|nr:hypothetical protein [Actinomadura coerulea]MBB6396884.1 hypothetical protein [Actinomadura coerulea]GGP95085.1 hypothetical protein GCM10010187_08220 [Actinomadura coerulea]
MKSSLTKPAARPASRLAARLAVAALLPGALLAAAAAPAMAAAAPNPPAPAAPANPPVDDTNPTDPDPANPNPANPPVEQSVARGTYIIRNSVTNGALIPFNGGPDSGNFVDTIRDWPSKPSMQHWKITKVTERQDTSRGVKRPAYKIENIGAPGQCLQPNVGVPRGDHADIIIQNCSASPTAGQQWFLVASEDTPDGYLIKPVGNAGRALVPAHLNSDNHRVRLLAVSDTSSYSWLLERQGT